MNIENNTSASPGLTIKQLVMNMVFSSCSCHTMLVWFLRGAYINGLKQKRHNSSAFALHYIDVIMITMASQITSLTVVYSTVCSGVDQRKHQSSVSLAFVWGIHRDRWIPRTKGQLPGKCFHLVMSSWELWLFCIEPSIFDIYSVPHCVAVLCWCVIPLWCFISMS